MVRRTVAESSCSSVSRESSYAGEGAGMLLDEEGTAASTPATSVNGNGNSKRTSSKPVTALNGKASSAVRPASIPRDNDEKDSDLSDLDDNGEEDEKPAVKKSKVTATSTST